MSNTTNPDPRTTALLEAARTLLTRLKSDMENHEYSSAARLDVQALDVAVAAFDAFPRCTPQCVALLRAFFETAASPA